jgi:hypothetical protein
MSTDWKQFRNTTIEVPRADGSTVTLEVELEEWAANVAAVDHVVALLTAAIDRGDLAEDFASEAFTPLQGLRNVLSAGV